jgi:hypothetical protein
MPVRAFEPIHVILPDGGPDVAAADEPRPIGLALQPVDGQPQGAAGVGQVHALDPLPLELVRREEGDAGRPVHDRIAAADHGQKTIRRSEHLADPRRSVGEGARRVVGSKGGELGLDDGAHGRRVLGARRLRRGL